MWQQQEAGDRLANIIQRLQSRRETGQLTVKHGRGAATEEGIIVFDKGKIVEARIGQRTGSEVFNRMSRWENCSCRFARFIDIATGSPEMLAGAQTNMPPYISIDPSLSPMPPLGKFNKTNSGSIPSASGVPHITLQHQAALHTIEQIGFSRAHRRLFLLIDGRRSIPDLIRLMAKGADEVYKLLQDLERAAIIHIVHEPPNNQI